MEPAVEDSGTIVVRMSIRWGDNAAGEPISTLVLTSPGRYYIDVRAQKAPGNASIEPTWRDNLFAPLDGQVAHAFAGVSTYVAYPLSKPKQEPKANPVGHGKWEHWVDTQLSIGEKGEGDEGEIFNYPPPEPDEDDGQVEYELETGIMTNIDTGKREPYEEIWANVTAVAMLDLPKDTAKICVVLKTRDEDASWVRGMIVRVGWWCQGIVRRTAKERDHEEVIIERWRLLPERGSRNEPVWKSVLVYPSGPRLPTKFARLVDDSRMSRVGTEFRHDNVIWMLTELVT